MTTYLPNLSQQNLITGPAIWDFEFSTAVPEATLRNKELRTKWILSPKTKHCVYSLVRGTNTSIRVSKDNPSRLICGIVGDYDSPVSMDTVIEAVGNPKQCPYRPAWYERTLSGNARLLWFFEKPVLVAGNEHAGGFLAFVGERLRLKHVVAGLDKAYTDPTRCYTNGCLWSEVGGDPLPHALVTGWLADFSRKFGTKKLSPVAIPLDVAAKMLAERYPRFSEWTGEFTEGAQGPSFWVNGSVSPRSAIVRAEGLFTFADHAVRSFSSWADLLGKDAVDKYVTTRIGEAVSDVYFENGTYWYPHRGIWIACRKEDITIHLKVCRSVSHKTEGDAATQLECALSHIQLTNRVESAVPLPHFPSGIIHQHGIRILNTATVQLLLPAPEPVDWGESGQMPFISLLLDSIFSPVSPQREAFLAWLSYAYQTAHAKNPQPGQVVFLVGGTSIGKTLLSQRIVGGLFGGFSEATSYLMGNDFGAQMFEHSVWCVDDGESASTAAGHRRFSEICKKIAANTSFEFHAKYRMPKNIQWAGRCIVTCNNDAVSMRQLPAMDGGSADKISLFRCIDKHDDSFVWPGNSRVEIERTISVELPFFARWLLDYVPAQDEPAISRSIRHGYSAYRHPIVVNSANNSSEVSAFDEILIDWQRTYFAQSPGDTWIGTATQLFRELHVNPLNSPAMRPYTIQNVTRSLASIKDRGLVNLDYTETETGPRIWTIHRPLDIPEPEKSNGAPPRHRAS